MSDLNIKPTHKPIKTYYAELEKDAQLGEENEGTVRAAFQNLLQYYCHQFDFTLLCDAYQEVNISVQHAAVSKFKETVSELSEKLAALIKTECQTSTI